MTTVQVPIGEISIAEAAQVSTDGGEFWAATMPAILYHYPSITPTAYWELTVSEHRGLYDYLVFLERPVGVTDGG